MAAMFGALNRFISRLDADPTSLQNSYYQQQQQQPDTTVGDTAWGFQVLRNKNQNLPLEPWFDFIIGINGHAIDDPDPNLFATEVRNCAGGSVRLEVWSAKRYQGQKTHTAHIPVPPDSPSLGLTLQLAPLSSTYNIWHVLSIPSPLSPAFTAGLLPHHDYILGTPSGTLRGESALQELVADHLDTTLTLWVYNSEFDVVREVQLVPRRGWGGEGILGAELGMGVLHRLPAGLGEEVQEPGEALFESKGDDDVAAQAGVGRFFVPIDAPLPSSMHTRTTSPRSVTSAAVPARIPSTPPPLSSSTPLQPQSALQTGNVPPPPPQRLSTPTALKPQATPATHGRAARKNRHAHAAVGDGLGEYLAESEKQSQEQDYALTKNTTPVPPPPKARGGPAPPPPPAAIGANADGEFSVAAKETETLAEAETDSPVPTTAQASEAPLDTAVGGSA
ncbi:hypothetical protein KEM54_000551 [Ascosphaera aggregata]|nr:hypothetical protein KEM54_000551 [Ascosphaera aggregata]